ncbi:fatty acyl-CoA synthetase [Arthrobacter gengyunqii]|uniref:AMP-binding protein n=1 Tax=Arthrobacter gengyunqii TaxID=2886940 RepID=A0A9X1M1P1_9MICC|nr:fatty acyl-CoA synthetase [Arthrobacter gengyunqii]MCC3269220.1 AMP-binding protein [Arthrobacter gengyunqii]UOY94823.1 fatty acyl-CoA synthetase [Arthrobacter gengyunqii]
MSVHPLLALSRSQSLGDLPRRSALRFPERTAVVDGDVRLSFADFERAVGAAAAALQAHGITPGDRLALLSRNNWQFAALAFATARAGVVLVPINFMLGADEVAYVLDHSGATAFVVQDALVPVAEAAMEAAETDGVVIRTSICSGMEPAPAGWGNVRDWFEFDGGTAPLPVVADDDPVRLMYTSGTESRPKGALMSSRSLMWEYVSAVVDGYMTADDVDLHTLPLYHCAQLDCFLGPDIYLGATSIILPAPDPAAILAAIEREKVTKFFAPPTVWISLLRSPLFDAADLSSLRKGYYGASAMPVQVLKELRQRLPDVRFWNFYGQTEMAPVATILGPEDQLAHAGSAGRPSLNVETAVVDDDDRPVPPGTVGEIVHRSPHATLGYYRDPERTAEAFANGWFHSGDLGYFDDEGYLSVVDRKKDMIKTGGENVASREVEEAIYLLDGVAEAAVFGVPHPHWVEAVAAVVVPRPGVELVPEEVMAHTRSLLAGYKTPKYVIIADALPKNPSGKIVKRQLRNEHTDLGTSSAAILPAPGLN